MDNCLIDVHNVSKKFCRSLKRSLWYGVNDIGREIAGVSADSKRTLREKEFWAVRDLNLHLNPGDCLGLIGDNGAGKTTLLRMLSGLIKPDQGQIRIRGQLAALIALGAGFNPVLTGRENVYVNAAVLGLSKKATDAKFDEIVDFAELGEFIDSPLQSYSSGMLVRLGFAVATAIEPDVLILDEILAVGDTRFRARCFERINATIARGGAIILVSHALEQVAHHCNRAVLLEHGTVVHAGSPMSTLEHYRARRDEAAANRMKVATKDDSLTGLETFHRSPYYNPSETRWGDKAATIKSIEVSQNGRPWPAYLTPGTETNVDLLLSFHEDVAQPVCGLTVKAASGAILFSTNSLLLGVGANRISAQRAGDELRVKFTFKPFLDSGDYTISVGLASETPAGIQPHDRRFDAVNIRIAPPFSATGDIDLAPSFSVTRTVP